MVDVAAGALCAQHGCGTQAQCSAPSNSGIAGESCCLRRLFSSYAARSIEARLSALTAPQQSLQAQSQPSGSKDPTWPRIHLHTWPPIDHAMDQTLCHEDSIEYIPIKVGRPTCL